MYPQHLLLMQVWPGLAMSMIFNRSFIAPPFACYCDRYWTPLDKCRVPGAYTERIPFLCPQVGAEHAWLCVVVFGIICTSRLDSVSECAPGDWLRAHWTVLVSRLPYVSTCHACSKHSHVGTPCLKAPNVATRQPGHVCIDDCSHTSSIRNMPESHQYDSCILEQHQRFCSTKHRHSKAWATSVV